MRTVLGGSAVLNREYGQAPSVCDLLLSTTTIKSATLAETGKVGRDGAALANGDRGVISPDHYVGALPITLAPC
jgi:hypothetical protein